MDADREESFVFRVQVSTEYEDLEQEARVVLRCGIYDQTIYKSTGSWLTKDELRQIIN